MSDLELHEQYLELLTDASAMLNARGEIVSVNSTWRKFAELNGGDAGTCYVGRNYLETCDLAEGEASAMASKIGAGIRKVVEGSAAQYRAEYPCHAPTERRWFEVVVSSLTIDGERTPLVSHRDISIRKIQAESLVNGKRAVRELAALVASSPDGVISYDLDGKIQSWNAGAEALYGYTAQEIIGESMEVLYPDDWPVRIGEYRDKIISGELSNFDVLRKAKNGELKHISISAAPVRDEAGGVISISNFHRDIGDRIAAENQLKVLTEELNHRVKNIISVIHAILQITARGAEGFTDFNEKFDSRLQSLLASHDLLVSGNWSAVPLDRLVKSHLRLFSEAGDNNVSITGPPARLVPKAIEVIAMCLHELATNAVKYDALSRAERNVNIDWKVKDGVAGKRLILRWNERTDTPVKIPSSTGYGHLVLTRNVRRALDARARVSFGRNGVSWAVSVPDEHFESE